MWVCLHCKTEHEEDELYTCWNCSHDRDDDVDKNINESFVEKDIVRFKIFRGVLTSFEALFVQASEFSTNIGRENLISISHSEDANDGVVTVWYWAKS